MSEGNRRRILLVDLPEALADGLIAATTMAADWRRVAAAEVDVELDHWAPDVMVVGTVDDDASRARVAEWCASVQDCEAVVIRPAGSGTTSAWLRAGAFAALTLPIEDDALAAATADPSIAKFVTGTPRKVIFVKGRLLNIVV